MGQILGLDGETSRVNGEIDIQRAKLGGVNAARTNNDAIDKQVRVLENRLDKALVKFNKALAVNKRLRVVIDNLRRERLVFDNVYHKFERELMEQKKQMADIIETSNAAYEARDEAQTKIIALREKAEKEFQSYIQEIKELDRALEHDRKLKEFMATKTMHRAGQPLSTKTGVKKEKENQSNGSNLQETQVVSLDTYENAFSKIRKVTGISDIGELVQRFKAVEDQNFSLFNYVNEINNEIEVHAEETVDFQRKIDVIKIESVAADEERKAQLKTLETQLSAFNDKSTIFQKQDGDINIITGDLTKGIETLLASLQRIASQKRPVSPGSAPVAGHEDESPEQSLISQKRNEKLRHLIEFALPRDTMGQSGVNETNLVQFLGLIEHKSNELLTLNYIINSPKKVTQLLEGCDGIMPCGGVAGLLGQGPTAQIGNITIIAPSTG